MGEMFQGKEILLGQDGVWGPLKCNLLEFGDIFLRPG